MSRVEHAVQAVRSHHVRAVFATRFNHGVGCVRRHHCSLRELQCGIELFSEAVMSRHELHSAQDDVLYVISVLS